jgi:hypothetical protein
MIRTVVVPSPAITGHTSASQRNLGVALVKLLTSEQRGGSCQLLTTGST